MHVSWKHDLSVLLFFQIYANLMMLKCQFPIVHLQLDAHHAIPDIWCVCYSDVLTDTDISTVVVSCTVECKYDVICWTSAGSAALWELWRRFSRAVLCLKEKVILLFYFRFVVFMIVQVRIFVRYALAQLTESQKSIWPAEFCCHEFSWYLVTVSGPSKAISSSP